jgi:DNA replication and repair protein RecF
VRLATLRLESFRNFSSLALELEEGLNFFFGPNGSGKTTILEAVSCLAVARSLRGASDLEVVKWGEGGFGVGGELREDGRSRSIVFRFTRGGAKEVTVDGERIAKLSDLLGLLRVAWFSPEDTWLTKGGPEERRRLLDMTLCQIDPAYLAALSSYRRALRQRNEALLAWTPDEEADRLVEVWTDRLVEYGSRVVAGRLALLPRLAVVVAGFHGAISGGDSISLSYRSSVGIGDAGGSGDGSGEPSPPDEALVRRRFLESIGRCEGDERRRGFTLVGPHRDDLEVRLGGRLLRSFGSQGQHRTAAIALKLGEAAVLAADGRGAVVLLDDILSELDERRAAKLVELVRSLGQALVTSTRPAPSGILASEGSACFRVEGGEVVRQ